MVGGAALPRLPKDDMLAETTLMLLLPALALALVPTAGLRLLEFVGRVLGAGLPCLVIR